MLEITVPRTAVEQDPFTCVLALLGSSESSVDAAIASAAMLPPRGRLVLAAVADTDSAGRAAIEPRRMARRRHRDALTRLAEAQRACDARPGHLLVGDPVRAGLAVARAEAATLIAVRGPEPGREPFTGDVAAGILRAARGSVLVVRAGLLGAPRRIVAGVDGRRGGARAAAAAAELAARCGARLTLLAASGGRPLDLERLHMHHPGAEIDPRPPADALVAAAQDADLVVVGSRGLRGLPALGSVGDRVSSRAACSVLTVRRSR
jgi:nucleotide-binding universal stress UspA family protein